MKDSVVVFFFTSSNHLSNVKTLQSIYKQDYPHIRLIVCNDCTYGFESERFLNNLEHRRPFNVEHIILQENRVSLGEYRSQSRFWKQNQTGYFLTIHAGECFVSDTALSNCVQKLRANSSVSAILCGCECRDVNMKNILSKHEPAAIIEDGKSMKMSDQIRDCMVIYRTSVLYSIDMQLNERETQISRKLIPWLQQNGHRLTAVESVLCVYSVESTDCMIRPVPEELGSNNIERISALLREAENCPKPDQTATRIRVAPRHMKRNIFLLLKKLSTISRIMMYACFTLLLFIAGSFSLNLETGLFVLVGWCFVIFAALGAIWTVGMLVSNLYLKKNPHRMVG